MRFKMPRNRTLASTCGLSIEFVKNEFHLVPPAMYGDVLAAGGVPEDEIDEAEMPSKPPTPEMLDAREQLLFTAFEKIAKRNNRNDFTAGGQIHLSVLSKATGVDWDVTAKERDAAWVKFQAKAND